MPTPKETAQTRIWSNIVWIILSAGFAVWMLWPVDASGLQWWEGVGFVAWTLVFCFSIRGLLIGAMDLHEIKKKLASESEDQ